MNHPHPTTPIKVENSTDVGLANCSIKHKNPKSTDMRFHWILDRILQKQVNVYWRPVPTNLGDYNSKHHPVSNHQKLWYTNLYEPHLSQTTLQGCVNPPNSYSACIITSGMNGKNIPTALGT